MKITASAPRIRMSTRILLEPDERFTYLPEKREASTVVVSVNLDYQHGEPLLLLQCHKVKKDGEIYQAGEQWVANERLHDVPAAIRSAWNDFVNHVTQVEHAIAQVHEP